MKTLLVTAVSFLCVASLLGLASCNCTLADCGEGVLIELEVDGDPAALDGARVRVCRNLECAGGSLEITSSSASCGFDDPSFFALCSASVVDGKLRLEVDVEASDDGDDEDVYSLRVSAASDDDDVIAEVEGRVQHESYYPNGELCGPTCYRATL